MAAIAVCCSRHPIVYGGSCCRYRAVAARCGPGLAPLPGRRPLPTALHTTAVTETGTHGAGKHKGAGSKGKASAHAAGASSAGSSAGRHGSKAGKGKHGKAEPEDDVAIPMFKAKRSAAPLEREGRAPGRGVHAGRHHEVFVSEPAPLASSYRHGGHAVAVHSAHFIEREPVSVPVHTAHTASAPSRWTAPVAPRHESVAEAQPKAAPATVAANRPEAYAEGVSHPDDDERMPRMKADSADDAVEAAAPIVRVPATSPAPAAHVSAAPTAAPAVPATHPAVVQGFGAEVAMPSAGSSDRPGGTRRRNHPSNWQPESLVGPTLPLDEREAITEAAMSPMVLPELYDHSGHLMMPAPLKGSHDVLVHQNVMATSDGLERINDDSDLDRLRAAHQLVSFPVIEGLRVNDELPMNRRVARPWTVSFAVDLASGYYARFHQPLWVTSAVRTVHYQARLQMVNGNAAAISGDAASPHLTGQAIDFGKRGMSAAQLAWMRDALLPLMRSGKIDVEEEFHQACFHVSVYRSYNAGRRVMREYAQVRGAGTAAGDNAGGGTENER